MKKKILLFFRLNSLLRHFIYWTISLFIVFILSKTASLIEQVYFQWFYPLVALSNRWFFSFFSVSIGDLLYILGLFYLFYLLVILVFQYKNLKTNLLKLSRFLLLVFWLFYLSWGFNYFRPSLAKKLDLKADSYTINDLIKTGEILRDSANYYQLKLTGNDSISVEVTYGIERILRKTPEGYKVISSYIQQDYIFPVIKKSLLSKLISYLHVTGYLNPFTNEAQINSYYPKFALPFIASHEVAHQLGYAPEDEANFLGFISSIHHPDPYFNYSGYSAALYYVLAELKKYDAKNYEKMIETLNRGVKKNYNEEYLFYKKYQTRFDTTELYDSYLKLNQQKSGIQSYNRMIKLLIAYYKQQGFLFDKQESDVNKK